MNIQMRIQLGVKFQQNVRMVLNRAIQMLTEHCPIIRHYRHQQDTVIRHL